jgi:hypothetical protein
LKPTLKININIFTRKIKMSDNIVKFNKDEFNAACDKIDLSNLYAKTFAVSLNLGENTNSKFRCDMLRGPYNFCEMARALEQLVEVTDLDLFVVVMDKNIVSVNDAELTELKYLHPDVVESIIFDPDAAIADFANGKAKEGEPAKVLSVKPKINF